MQQKPNTARAETEHAIQLPRRNPDQSVAGYIRAHLHEIEAAIAVGFKAPAIRAALAAAGAFTTPDSYDVALYRERERLRKAKSRAPVAPPVSAPAPALPSPPRPVVPPPANKPALRLTPSKDLKPEDFV